MSNPALLGGKKGKRGPSMSGNLPDVLTNRKWAAECLPKKKPERVWRINSGEEQRASHDQETHLKRQSDL
jgi:hypothetical protein